MEPGKYKIINLFKWWVGGVGWDIAIALPHGKINLWIIGLCGHRYAFSTIKEWVDHHEYIRNEVKR